ncbi:MAG: ATP-binding protein [Pseudomonadota bacterium]
MVLPKRYDRFLHLRLIVLLSLVVPASLFGWTTWETRQAVDAQTDERIERSLDVLQEHALKALQTVERSIAEVNEVLRDLDEGQIREQEADLYLRFKRTQQALPQIESIWAFDRDGRPLVASTILPVPRELDVSDRSYFRAHEAGGAGTFVGEIVQAPVGPLRLFVVSGRRDGSEPGRFDGVIAITVMPGHFGEFYAKLARSHEIFTLLRADGAVLARWPELAANHDAGAGPLTRAFARNPESGMLTAASRLDGVERRLGYRRVPGFPLYVAAGIATAAVEAEFWRIVLTRAAVALPAVLAMVGLALYALRHARRMAVEETRREAAEAALKQAQRLEALGQLTGGVAHDFNNLLMIVRGSAERLERLLGEDARVRRSLEAIDIAVTRGTELTRHLLSFSRRQTHETAVVDLGQRLPALQDILRSSLRGDITIDIQLAPGLWPVTVDNSEFELALLNLAVNARDAMTSGGRLAIDAKNVVIHPGDPLGIEGDFVAVRVGDTGAGIPPQILGRVFEPFFTTKEVGKGTGLGLSQVYGFARQSGGTATIASVPGQGTTVTLYLPRATSAERHAIAADRPERSACSAEGERSARVLLVEDNPAVAEVTRALLEELGYRVRPAANVADARLALDREQVDVVLSDIVMPGGADGLDLAREVRGRSRLPVVLASGYSEKAQQAADEGFALLRKPYDSASLDAALTAALAGTPSRKGPPA